MKTTLQLAQGAIRDQIRQPIYDTVQIAAAESPIATRNFFTAVQGKAKYLSNLRVNRQLEGEVSFRIQGMKMECQNIYQANCQALPLIMEHSSLKLEIGEKIYWEGSMRSIVGGLTVVDAVAVGATILQRHYSAFGAAKPFGILYKKNETLDIKPLQTFSVEWRCEGMVAAEITLATPAAASKLNFILSLNGLQRRPVQ